MTDERVQYDGVELDEIVAEGVTLHLEKMDAHHWMVRAYRPATWNSDGVLTRTDVEIHLSANDLFEMDTTTGLPEINRPAIAFCHEWDDRSGRHHQCYATPNGHARHKCTCGATVAKVNLP